MTIGEAWLHPDTGRWMVPVRAEDEEGAAVGIGWEELTEENPQYHEWVEFIELRAKQLEAQTEERDDGG